MRRSCGAFAARLSRVVCAARFQLVCAAWMLSVSAPLTAQEAPAKKPNSMDVLDAPPPAPELTETDDSKPPEAEVAEPKPPPDPPARKRTAATPKPAPAAKPDAKPAPAAQPARDAKPANDTGTAAKPASEAGSAAQPARDAKPASDAGAAAKPAGEAGPTAKPARDAKPASEAGPAGKPASPSKAAAGAPVPAETLGEDIAEPTPPPPPIDGDFAGPGAVAAAADDPQNTAPQDDFVAEAQEYTRRKKREYSVRIDLLNWLLLGRLSVELEAGLWKFLSVQLTPVFVLARSPIAINYAGVDDPLTQHSNGIGPISGISLGVGAWLWGEPFKGYVLRLEFTNYGYSYRTQDSAGQIDRVDFTERRAILFVGSHSRFGVFTFAGGFGLGFELNQQERCGLRVPSNSDEVRAGGGECRGRQQIALDREVQDRADLNGPLHPVYFQARFSIGVVF